jgi:phospholipase/carboxylesterase
MSNNTTNSQHPIIKQLSDQPKKLLVFLHGVGSDGHDLLSLAPFIQQDFLDIYFMSPHGIEQYEGNSYGYQWFSLRDRENAVLQRELTRATPQVLALIEVKLKELSLEWKDVVLVGFSQGAMLALYLTLLHSQKFSSTIAIAGALITPAQLPSYLSKTPICLIHGSEDQVLHPENLLTAEKKLTSLNFPVEAHKIDNLGHSIDVKVIELLKSFIVKNAYV